ncbi:S-adenosyl-L-methionine-dependent methyltransferase [Xylariaceae sp. FL1651]|nr:S-adenosyl-L-methionine-dependent methyltransferase [Xylariaceae sp. FL1651]
MASPNDSLKTSVDLIPTPSSRLHQVQVLLLPPISRPENTVASVDTPSHRSGPHLMEKSKGPNQNLGAGDLALRPATSSTLSIYSQSEQQAPSPYRRGSIRPQTPSSSSQSGTQPDWDPASHSYYGSRATTSTDEDHLSTAPSDFWPRPDSDDDTGDELPSRQPPQNLAALPDDTNITLPGYEFLPNDAQEKDRNVLQHSIVLEMFDGKLHLAPVTNPRRILDLGCGPGNWPLDFAKRNPNTAVLGIDIEPIKPPFNLPNCRFQVADFNDKWSYGIKFDLIHLRHLGNLPSKDVIASIYENLNPGGWGEFTEWIVYIQATHNSFSETSFYKWWTFWQLGKFCNDSRDSTYINFSSGLTKLGTSVYYPLEYKRLLLEAGFKNVTERKYAGQSQISLVLTRACSGNTLCASTPFYQWSLLRMAIDISLDAFPGFHLQGYLLMYVSGVVPVNPWPPNKQLKRIGSMMALNINTILEPLSMPIFTGVLEWSPDTLQSLLTEVRKEIADLKIHAFMTLLTVYAQKPRGESSSASSVRSAEPG